MTLIVSSNQQYFNDINKAIAELIPPTGKEKEHPVIFSELSFHRGNISLLLTHRKDNGEVADRFIHVTVEGNMFDEFVISYYSSKDAMMSSPAMRILIPDNKGHCIELSLKEMSSIYTDVHQHEKIEQVAKYIVYLIKNGVGPSPEIMKEEFPILFSKMIRNTNPK